ncbi:MAG: 4-(cytidine 5'-diphospho)-2-C-methyl-D-erythritol kinase [Simkania sp.]|nr:4-(cytidine 5'-diphospho)-2-C-methyl-D-erythritol kinase [Simkania sp.]
MFKFFSPAKLNLFFRVLHKRNDGFHEIASLYQAIDLGDDLEMSFSDQDELTCSDPSLSCGEDNLICKAINAFRNQVGFSDFHMRCHLTKRIPIQTGVGGGSSNAATALYACNELSGRPLSYAQLFSIAAELGSDVAFFFSSGSAYCTGRGERVQDVEYPVDKVFSENVWLAKPLFGIGTPEVYKACKPAELPARDPQRVLDSFKRGEPIWFNDLQSAVQVVSPLFSAYIQQLQSCGFTQTILTGSGSGVVCFGLETPPEIQGIRFYPIQPLVKNSQDWYPFPKASCKKNYNHNS